MQHHPAPHSTTKSSHGSNHYRRLLFMAVLSLLAMYWLMYAMVDRLGNVYPNLNQFYMAGLMTPRCLSSSSVSWVPCIRIGGSMPSFSPRASLPD